MKALQVDAAETSAVLLQHAVGNLQPTGRCRSTVKLQNRLRHPCQQHVEGTRLLADFLRAVGHGEACALCAND